MCPPLYNPPINLQDDGTAVGSIDTLNVTGLTMAAGSANVGTLSTEAGNGIVNGTTSAPTTTSATYVVIPEMTVTITTSGRPVLVMFSGQFNIQTNDNWFVAIFSDTTQVTGTEANNHFFGGSLLGLTPAAITAGVANCMALVTGLAAGSHTFDARWKVSGGTARAITTERQIIAVEI